MFSQNYQAGNVNYDWAMLVNENINVNEKCFLMPASSNVTFTRVTVNGNKATPWTKRANCNGTPLFLGPNFTNVFWH